MICCFHSTEAVVRRCSVKKMFLNISQNSQENTCARCSFLIKLQSWRLQLFKREILAQVFSCEFCKLFKNSFFYIALLPNGHIFVDSPSNWRRNSTWKVRGNYIDFEWRIHVEIMTSIRRGYFNVDFTFEIDEISMSSPRGFFYVVPTSNQSNFCTHCFHSIIF